MRGILAEVLGVPLNNVRVLVDHMGGGFGAKQDLFQHEFLCALMARETSRAFGADMVGDEAHDALTVGRREPLTRVRQTFREAVDPETTVGVEHHLDDAGVPEESGNGGTEGGPQHAGPAKYRL